MFGVVLVFAVTLMQGYVFWRAASVPAIRRHVPASRLVGAGIVIWAIFVLGRVVGHEAAGSAAAAFELAAMIWLGLLFLTAMALLAVDAATGFGFLFPRIAPRLRGVALAAGLALAALALVQGLRPPVVQEHHVRLAGLPAALDGTVIVALSDLHLGSLRGAGWLAARVAQVEAERPDLVLLLGDVFEGHGPPGPEVLAAMAGLSAPAGVWAVLGNHEFHSAQTDNAALFARAGLKLLRNGWAEPRPGLVLAGIEMPAAHNDHGQAGAALARALADRPPGATVLLSHAPLPADLIAGRGIGLMLSGHTHGGQLWPWGYVVERWFPLLEGRYDLAGTTVLVGRGTGSWGPPMRLWRPGEILRVTLHTAP